ncbi:hypothetical protein E4U21_005058 [Claviceps maximensis]|nr:hypothetical protein E4U21_005058 [Claviceps maximensis]
MTVDSSSNYGRFHDESTLTSITRPPRGYASVLLPPHLPPPPLSPLSPPSPPSPPWRTIDGVFNVRDFGGHPVMTTSSLAVTRPGLILRSAHLEHITETGIQQLLALRVCRIFDLRGAEESAQYKSVVHDSRAKASGGEWSLPPCSAVPFDTVDDKLSLRLEKYAPVMEGFVPESIAAKYLALATSKSGIHAFQTILGHLLTHPRQSILIHCTLGKDRTGIVFALLLSLAGVSDEVIAADYALSEQGLEPARAKMVSVIGELCPSLTPSLVAHKVDGIIRQCHAQCILGFLHLLREECGGADGYARGLCQVSESDVSFIQEVLTVQS